MSIIALIPAILCAIALFRYSPAQVFLRVHLPFFLLFPGYYYWKIMALPPITVGESTLIPLGVALLFQARRYRLHLTDIWMVLFILSTFVADRKSGYGTASMFQLWASLIEAMVPYMIGKLLIEQDQIRLKTAQRISWLLAICGLISFYEYRMQYNPFTLVWARFFPGELFAWKTQLRWGGGRVSGPFGQSELAGMIFLFGFVLALWVVYAAKDKSHFGRLPFTRSTWLAIAIFCTLLTTQARGPWLGCLISVPIALIGRTKHVVRNTLMLMVVMIPAATVGYIGLKAYSSSGKAPTSEAQQNAQYRSDLLVNYIPVAEQGGWWGWGNDFPRIDGQDSIDNEYLYVALRQGWIGFFSLCLLAADCLVKLAVSGFSSGDPVDRSFAFSLLGVFIGLLITIFTVFLGNQAFQLFFLLVGWSQALYDRRRVAPGRVYEFEDVIA